MAASDETKLQRASQLAKYGDLFFRTPDSALLINPQTYQIVDANDAFERLTGKALSEVTERSILSWIPAAEHDFFEKRLRIARRRYFAQTWDCRWQAPNQEWLHFTAVACMLKLSDGTEVMQLLLRDSTAEKKAKEEVLRYVSELQVANERLRILSTTDELTQLENVRTFRQRIAVEHARSERYHSNYAVLFIDADHFKKYNDTHGHQAGDRVLKEIAEVIRQSCRTVDFAGRYGGEEFVVLCPETDGKGAEVVAERIRLAVASLATLDGVTVSIGVAEFPSDAETSEGVVKLADEALYASKAQGRNRVTLHQNLVRKAS